MGYLSISPWLSHLHDKKANQDDLPYCLISSSRQMLLAARNQSESINVGGEENGKNCKKK